MHIPSSTGPAPVVQDAPTDIVREATAFLSDLLGHGEEVPFDELAQALADAGLLCTVEERAVIAAIINETHAETANAHAFRRAANATRGSHLIDAATRTRDQLIAATEQRRAAVTNLEAHRTATG